VSVCLSVRMFVVEGFSNCYFSYSLSLILTKFGARDLCASTQKSGETYFQNFDGKILANFLNFTFVLSLWNTFN